MTISSAVPFDTDERGDSNVIGSLGERISCMRYQLDLGDGEYFASFDLQIGDSEFQFPSPQLVQEGEITENDLLANKFYCAITTDQNVFLHDTKEGYLDKDKILTTKDNFVVNVTKEGEYYKIDGTFEYQIFAGRTYYLWVYAYGDNGTGYGRLESTALEDEVWVTGKRPLGLAKIYLPKATDSTEYEYKNALVYIYTNNTWQLALPYIYTGGTWKNTC